MNFASSTVTDTPAGYYFIADRQPQVPIPLKMINFHCSLTGNTMVSWNNFGICHHSMFTIHRDCHPKQ